MFFQPSHEEQKGEGGWKLGTGGADEPVKYEGAEDAEDAELELVNYG